MRGPIPGELEGAVKAERWQRVEQLYHAALAREAGERAAYLSAACADDDALTRRRSFAQTEASRNGHYPPPGRR